MQGLSKIKVWLKKFCEFYDRLDYAIYPLIGIADYEKYLRHFKKTHPGKTPLSKEEFFRESQDTKANCARC